MRESRDDPADQIVDQITNVPEPIFNVVPKDKKKKHVAKDVRDAAVHEHRRDQREPNRNGRRLQPRHLHPLTGKVLNCNGPRDDVATGDDLARDRRVGVRESIVAAQALEKDEHKNVDEDQDVVDDRSSPAISVVVCNGKKHLLLIQRIDVVYTVNVILNLWMLATPYTKSSSNGTNERQTQIFASMRCYLRRPARHSLILFFVWLSQAWQKVNDAKPSSA